VPSGANLREEKNLHEVVLEAPMGQRRRIDVKVVATVFEVKRDRWNTSEVAECIVALRAHPSRSGLASRQARSANPDVVSGPD
jgi:hypothetical protein